MNKNFGLLALVLLTVSACDADSLIDDDDCTTEVLPAFYVNIVDADTSERINCSATITLTSSAGDTIEEDLSEYADCDNSDVDYLPIYGDAGTYDISVEAPGYEDWSSTDVEVTDSGEPCNQNESVYLDIEMTPSK